MALFFWDKFKLIFLMYCFNLTLARHSNLGVHFVEPRQAYYYDDESSANMYQDDDVVCPDLTASLYAAISIGFKKCAYAIGTNNEMVLISLEYNLGCVTGGASTGPPFMPVLLQSYEVEPPTPCPIVEVEIRIKTYALGQYSPVNCSLLWGIIPDIPISRPHFLQDGRVVIYSECSEDPVDDPDSPYRIFTLIPTFIEQAHNGKKYARYTICPFKNLTCDDVSIAALEFPELKQLNFLDQ